MANASACSLYTITSLNYLATPFLVLSYAESMVYWGYWGFVPHGVAIALYILLPVVFKPAKSGKKD